MPNLWSLPPVEGAIALQSQREVTADSQNEALWNKTTPVVVPITLIRGRLGFYGEG